MGQSTIVGDPWGLTGTFGGNGTSFASPLMAGMVATLWQCHPNATAQQLISAIRQSASQSSAPDSLLGYGIPDFPLACLILGGIDSGIDANQDQLALNGPNPFTEALSFTFYSSARQTVEIRLFNLLGQPVYTETRTVNGIAMHEFVIDTPLAKGVYVLSVTAEKSAFSMKVIHD
jgi:subtilisin family serine protease